MAKAVTQSPKACNTKAKPSSVRSIRLSDEAWAWLAASAEGRKLTVNGFIAYLVNATRSGLSCSPSPMPPASTPALRKPAPTPLRTRVQAEPKFFGKTALGDPLPVRGAYQKGQKR